MAAETASTSEKVTTYPHDAVYARGHERPRWNVMKCRKCGREFVAHDSELGTWKPKLKDCVVKGAWGTTARNVGEPRDNAGSRD